MSLFTACSDDDEAPDYSKVIESEMAGNYKGTLTVTVEGTTMPSEPQKIKIEKAGTYYCKYKRTQANMVCH